MTKRRQEPQPPTRDAVISSPPPRHIAFIMDGNRRWAERRGLNVQQGHRAGVKATLQLLSDLAEREHIEVITLFAFSSENWLRPALEVEGLMRLLYEQLAEQEIDKLHANDVCLRFIGARSQFSAEVRRRLEAAEQRTADNSKVVAIALSYSGQWDITQAARALAQQVANGQLLPEQINEDLFASKLSLADLPLPDLCVRTSGEQRLSNFLLWQCAYTELHFCDVPWPDFDIKALDQVLADYQTHQRRFGKRPDHGD